MKPLILSLLPRVCPASLLLALAGSALAAEDLLTFKLACNNGVFTPNSLQVPAGKKFKIEISNTGTEAIEFESKPLRKEKALNPPNKSIHHNPSQSEP
ncbi:MAG: cupredoxin domain-containing protein [Polaromonas sp.]|nr:cupredoxin domain-containing protein [Polaromonas sp.]